MNNASSFVVLPSFADSPKIKRMGMPGEFFFRWSVSVVSFNDNQPHFKLQLGTTETDNMVSTLFLLSWDEDEISLSLSLSDENGR